MNREKLLKTARMLSFFTVGYNFLEGIVSIIFAVLSGSAALLGFGFDSFVESTSGAIMIWRFKKRENLSEQEEDRIEQRAIQLVGWSFVILGVYVSFEAAKKLYFKEEPDQTLVGILIAIASLIVMPILFILKLRTAKALTSRSMGADSKQTLGCILLSVALLIGLSANYLFDLWWMDPFAALFIAAFLIKEGVEAIKEKEICKHQPRNINQAR